MDLANQELQQGLEAEKKLYIRPDYKSGACNSEKPFSVIAGVFYLSSSGDSDHGGFDNLSGSHHFRFKRPLAVSKLDVINHSLICQ